MLARLKRLLAKARAKGARACLRADGRRLTYAGVALAARGRRALQAGAALAARGRTGAAVVAERGGYLLAQGGFHLGVLLLRALRVRFLSNYPHGSSWAYIGHLTAEPDCFIKEGRLGWRPRYRGVMLCPDRVANRCLLDYWRRYLWVITSPSWCRRLARFVELPSLRHWVYPYVSALNESGRFAAIQAAYAGRPPLLRLKKRHRADGEARLRQLGVPEGAWIVCVHCREGGYDNHAAIHTPRNCRIEDYLPALRALVDRGAWCLRVGDPTMTPLPPTPGVIEYAHSPLRCDWMDVFLCARSRFILGSASGLGVVATAFGVPCAVTNQTLPTFAYAYGPDDLLIPKLLWSRRQGRYLSFPEVADGPFANARFNHCLEMAHVEAHANTPEEIRDLALEMLGGLEGTFQETEQDRRLQEAYRSLDRPGHYAYGAGSRIGRLFLRKYQHLLTSGKDAEVCPGGLDGCGTTRCPCLAPGWVASRQRAA